ncbi:MAG TPA: ABC transporter permease [Vicinamibacterales bacterium]|nr:ABC transporter permease [Vicinamibacterales bacterium]
MTSVRVILSRLLGLFRRGRSDADLADDIRAHLDLLAADYRRRGLSAADAETAARRDFGSVEGMKEAYRDRRGLPLVEALLRDLQYGVRQMRRNPGFTAAAAATLTLGIGATTTMFSVVDGVLLRPLDYPAPERLVMLSSRLRGSPVPVTPGDFLDWRATNHAFENMTAFTIGETTLTGAGDPAGLLAGVVSARFAETLGMAPQLGRSFTIADEKADEEHPPAVILTAHLWRERFAASPSILGRTITLDGRPVPIVGVMPDRFVFPQDLFSSGGARALPDVALLLPLPLRPGDRGNAYLQVIGRLAPGVTVAQARAEMSRLAPTLTGRAAIDRETGGVVIVPLQQRIVEGVRPLLLTLFAAVLLLLVIACVNVANLLLARGAAREREFTVRRALGAGRGRLIQQYLTESVLLGVLGGAGGLVVAVFGVRGVAALIPRGRLPRVDAIHIDARVLLFAVVVSVLTALMFGLAPACRAGRGGEAAPLKAGNTAATSPRQRLGALVIAEVALAFVLVASAGVLLRSFDRLTGVDPGFRARDAVAGDVALPEGSYPTLESMQRFSTAVLSRLRREPGIAAAGAVNLLPIGGNLLMGDFAVEGQREAPGFSAFKPAVSPGYFTTMGVPIVMGRDFNDHDTHAAPLAMIVTTGFAHRFWSSTSDAVGKRVRLGFGPPEQDPWRTIVGVVGDVKQSGLGSEAMPALYVPIAQAPRPFLLRDLSFVVRAGGDARAAAPAIRDAIHQVDPLLPVGRLAAMSQLLADSVSEPRFRAVLLAGFAGAALGLIAIGILGVVGYTVTRRTREMGIRMALGARGTDVVGLVVKQSLLTSAVGVLAGVALAMPATRLLRRFLFEISPDDPVTFCAAAAVLVLLAVAASYVPARRAARVDPLIALRAE